MQENFTVQTNKKTAINASQWHSPHFAYMSHWVSSMEKNKENTFGVFGFEWNSVKSEMKNAIKLEVPHTVLRGGMRCIAMIWLESLFLQLERFGEKKSFYEAATENFTDFNVFYLVGFFYHHRKGVFAGLEKEKYELSS
jgi:hypothetical protein